MSNINISLISEPGIEFEVVERKGLGHPDTIADKLAENLSVQYSKYTFERFGAILHHNFDKTGLLGGSSFVQFGKGYLTKPIRVLLNGRASDRFGQTIIPVEKILRETVKKTIIESLPNIDPNKNIDIHYNLSTASSPGKTDEKRSKEGTRKYWFEPRNLDDLKELKSLNSNDTSLGCAYWPLSTLEKMVLFIETYLNSSEFKKNNPWCGSDIKIMGIRAKDQIDITLCVPQIANHVAGVEQYRKNLEYVLNEVKKIIKDNKFNDNNIRININTRDDYAVSELYLTATGSSIESGDEGLVGRGNRINGLITPNRPMSIEGACGKNPVYHIGKLYNIAAQEIAKKIYERYHLYNEVYLVSQSGRLLIDPWLCTVLLANVDEKLNNGINLLIQEYLPTIPQITDKLIQQKINLY